MATRQLTVALRAAVQGYTAGMAKAAAATGPLEKNLMRVQRTGMAMSRVGDRMTKGLTLPLLGIGIAAIKMATDFDTEMTKMTSLAGVAASEVDGMRDSVLALAGETGQAPKELAEAMFFIQSAGISGSAAMDVLDRSARAAATGMGTTKEMADLLTGAMQIYGIENLNATQAADIFTKAVENSKTEVDQVAKAITFTIPQADALGVSFMDVSGALAAMAATNSNMNENATQLNGLFSALTSITPEFRKRLQAVGVDADKLQGTMSEDGGLVAGMKTLWEATDGNATAFMALFPNIQAARGAASLAANDFAVADDVMAAMQDNVGALDNAFGVWAESMGAQNAQAFAEFQVSLIKVGDILIPIASQVVGFASDVAEAFSALPDGAQQAVVWFGLVVAASGPLLAVGGRLVKAFAGIVGAMANFAVPAGTVSGAFRDVGGSARGLSGSLGRVVRRLGPGLGLVGVLGIAMLALQEYNRRKEETKQLTEDFTQAIQREGESLAATAPEVLSNNDAFEELANILRETGVNVETFAASMENAGDEMDEVKTALSELLPHDDLGEQLRDLADGGNEFAAALSEVVEKGDLSGQEVIDLVQDVLALRDGFEQGVEKTRDQAHALGEVEDGSAELRSELQAQGVDVEALGEDWNSLSDAVKEYNDALQALFDPLFGMLDAVQSNDEAARGLEQAEKDLTAATKEHGKGSKEAEEAERALEQAHQDSAKSALALQIQANTLAAAIRAGELSVEDATGALDSWVEQGLITRETARKMEAKFRDAAKQADSLAGDYDVNVHTPGADAAKARIDGIGGAVRALPSSKEIHLIVRESVATMSRSPTGRQHGGPVRPNQLYLVGEKGPELLSVGGSGRVFPAHDPLTRAALSNARPAVGGAMGGDGGRVDVMWRIVGNGSLARMVHQGVREGDIQLQVDGKRVRV